MSDEQKSLSRKYLTYQMFASFWFISAVWLLFYRIYITDQQVGFLDGLAFAIGLVAEVPSGALADKFGRDRMVRLGSVLTGLGFIIQGLGSGFMQFFIGQTVMMIGLAFVSGADEALFFERLKFKRDSRDWRRLLTRGSQVKLVTTLFAVIVGGYLHTVNPRVPWILSGVTFIVAALIIWNIRDERPRQARQKFVPELKDYLHSITTGFQYFASPKLRVYIPLIITVQGLFYVTGFGILRPILLDRFHFSPFAGAAAIAGSAIITLGLLSYVHKYADTISERRILTVLGLSSVAGLLLSLGNIGMYGFIVIVILYAGEHIMEPFMSEILNNNATDDHRATILSVAAFLMATPYIVLAPLIGYLSTHEKLDYFLIVWSVLIVGSVLYYLSTRKCDAAISLPHQQ